MNYLFVYNQSTVNMVFHDVVRDDLASSLNKMWRKYSGMDGIVAFTRLCDAVHYSNEHRNFGAHIFVMAGRYCSESTTVIKKKMQITGIPLPAAFFPRIGSIPTVASILNQIYERSEEELSQVNDSMIMFDGDEDEEEGDEYDEDGEEEDGEDEEDAEEDGEGLEPGNLELMNAPLGFNPDDPNQEIDEAMMVDYLERNCLAWDELVPHSAPCSTTPTFDMLPMPWLLVETAALPSQTALGVDRFSLPENPVIIQGVDISASDGAVPNSALIQVNHSNLQIANLTLVC